MTLVIIILTLCLAAAMYTREEERREQVRERKEWELERSKLLQRIQAPTTVAYSEYLEELPPGAPAAPNWTDEDDWKSYGHLLPKATE